MKKKSKIPSFIWQGCLIYRGKRCLWVVSGNFGKPDLPAMMAPSHFKLNLNLNPFDHANQRRTYLALAYRPLGETMHMPGDMRQAAHGVSRSWFESGSKKVEGTMTDGLRTGVWYEWSENGSCLWFVDWDTRTHILCP